MTVVGIDSHKDALAAYATDDAGRVLEHRSLANTPDGHAKLACWVQAHQAVLVAMAGSGLYGRPAAGVLAEAGMSVVEVPPHMTAAARRRQLNKAIHTAALTQIAHRHTERRRCYQRRLDHGKTKREAIQALKRRISDRIWTHLNTGSLT